MSGKNDGAAEFTLCWNATSKFEASRQQQQQLGYGHTRCWCSDSIIIGTIQVDRWQLLRFQSSNRIRSLCKQKKAIIYQFSHFEHKLQPNALNLDTSRPHFSSLDDVYTPTMEGSNDLNEDLMIPQRNNTVSYDELRRKNRDDHARSHQYTPYTWVRLRACVEIFKQRLLKYSYFFQPQSVGTATSGSNTSTTAQCIQYESNAWSIY